MQKADVEFKILNVDSSKIKERLVSLGATIEYKADYNEVYRVKYPIKK